MIRSRIWLKFAPLYPGLADHLSQSISPFCAELLGLLPLYQVVESSLDDSEKDEMLAGIESGLTGIDWREVAKRSAACARPSTTTA